MSTATLRSLAEKFGMHIGTCANHQHLANDSEYRETMAREFNAITCENELKFRSLCPAEGEYNFEPADNLVAFAEQHNMMFRGHVLVWDDQLPNWLVNAGYSRSELIGILNKHIHTVVSRYAGRIQIWDVVNEAVDHNGELKQTFWYNGIGPEFIGIAFHAARNADPSAKFFYNDQGCEAGHEHHDGVYKLLKSLKETNVPVDGIGFQMHLSLEHFDKQFMHVGRLRQLGLEINITELDVRMRRDRQDLEAQAKVYSDIFQHFIAEQGCSSLTLWGFTDKYSWIPFFYPAENSATIMTEDFSPKPAYWALVKQFKLLIQSNLSWQPLHSSVQNRGRVLK